jgi:hypothetical protein
MINKIGYIAAKVLIWAMTKQVGKSIMPRDDSYYNSINVWITSNKGVWASVYDDNNKEFTIPKNI